MTTGITSSTDGSSPVAGDSNVSNVVALPERRPNARKQAVNDFVRDHPGLTLVGGVLAGMVASALIPRKPVKKLAQGASAMSGFVADAAVTAARRAIEQAGAAGSELRARGEHLAEQAESLGEAAARRAASLGHGAAERIEKLGEVATSSLGKAGIKAETIEKISEAASKVSKAGEAAASKVGKSGCAAIERAGELLAPAEATVEDAVKRLARTAADLRAKVRT